MFKPLKEERLAMFVPQIFPLETELFSDAKHFLFQFKIKNKQ